MHSHERTDHPSKRDKSHCIAWLCVFKAEWADMKAICDAHGSTQIVGVKKVPLIPVFEIEILCNDARTAHALGEAWWNFSDTSPHRPHGEDECMVWGEQFNPFPDLPREWTF
jgi:hypothetical protein